jgi:hypothetical protein
VQPSSLVFVAIVALWAAYLLPQWIRRRDALGASRGHDRHSLALRVLEPRRRGRPGPSSAPLLRRGAFSAAGQTSAPAPSAPAPWVLSAPAPSAPTVAARPGHVVARRATVLATLLSSTVLTLVGTMAGVVPGGVLALAASLLVADLAALRLFARRAGRRGDTALSGAAGSVARGPAGSNGSRRVSAVPAARVPVESRLSDVVEPEPDAPVGDSVDQFFGEAVDDGTWVPVPVPPPTYTLKPMAPRPAPASPLETFTPAAAGPAASASGATGLVASRVGASVASVSVVRPWSPDASAEVDLDSVLERRRAVNG